MVDVVEDLIDEVILPNETIYWSFSSADSVWTGEEGQTGNYFYPETKAVFSTEEDRILLLNKLLFPAGRGVSPRLKVHSQVPIR